MADCIVRFGCVIAIAAVSSAVAQPPSSAAPLSGIASKTQRELFAPRLNRPEGVPIRPSTDTADDEIAASNAPWGVRSRHRYRDAGNDGPVAAQSRDWDAVDAPQFIWHAAADDQPLSGLSPSPDSLMIPPVVTPAYPIRQHECALTGPVRSSIIAPRGRTIPVALR